MKIYLVLILMLYTIDGEMFYLLSTYSLKRSPNLTYGVLGFESDLKKDTRQYDFNKVDAFTGRNTIGNHRIRNFRRKREKETKNDIVGAIKEPMVFEDEKKMLKDGTFIKTGAIAYVKNGDKFFGKSSRGWLPFMMGPPVTNTTVNTTGTTTERPTKETIPKEVTKGIYETTMIKQPLPLEYMKKHPVHNPNKKELRLISTNKPYTGNMGGISNANLRCQKEAEFAGIDGIYRAFLA